MVELKNRCQWLMIGQQINCSGLAREGGHCTKHINKVSPSPCKRCERGTKTASQICSRCGYNKDRLRSVYMIKKCKKKFDEVMNELKIKSYHKLLNNL